jgi:hypothetical protein
VASNELLDRISIAPGDLCVRLMKRVRICSRIGAAMPEICRFYGIIVAMFYDDHNPPHFHARYGKDYVAIEISPLRVLEGHIPHRALGLVMEWAS